MMNNKKYYCSEKDKKSILLKNREMQILQQLNEGHSDKVIARKLHISASTVNFYLRSLYKKLGVNKRNAAVMVACEHSLIS